MNAYFWARSSAQTRSVVYFLGRVIAKLTRTCPRFNWQYLNDSTLKNVHWSLCTGLFNKRDVGRIEREFLDVLDFELHVTEADILVHHDAFTALKHARSHRSGRDTRETRNAPKRASIARRGSDASMASLESCKSSSPDSSLPTTPPTLPMEQDPAVVRTSTSSKSGSPRIASASPAPVKETHKLKRESSRRLSGFSILGRSIHVPHFHSSSASSGA